MKFSKYLKDKILYLSFFTFTYLTIILMLFAFKVDDSLIIAISLTLITFIIGTTLIDYFRKRNFYNQFQLNLERLDQKYLVLETITKPSFYEGEILYQSLYDINKSMLENIKKYELSINDFKEYIEMWIHEIKVPIASLILMNHNNDNFDKTASNQIKRIDNYIEQVLYYVRSENAEKDYLITENKLNKIISSVALKNKDDLLLNNIDFNVKNLNYSILTDSKWLEFILNQIINNSIKYKRDNNSKIGISAIKENDTTILTIYDNGIGIPKEDISKVFNKSFTGHNGRVKSKSTGMGLYIAKRLCTKLGHKIEIDSKKNDYTKVTITFNKNNYYDVIK